jgi:alkylhydroperoxidase/carboxymuconolactone decarboxylase family protein YurZ
MGEQGRTPMDSMRVVSPAAVATYLAHRDAIMANPDLAALPRPTKLLIGIGVASALQSSECTLMWTKQARAVGVAEAESVETITLARLMKTAAVNDPTRAALEWLRAERRRSSPQVSAGAE